MAFFPFPGMGLVCHTCCFVCASMSVYSVHVYEHGIHILACPGNNITRVIMLDTVPYVCMCKGSQTHSFGVGGALALIPCLRVCNLY